MDNTTSTPVRSPYLLDIMTYLTLAAMALLGISGLADQKFQAAAPRLCLLYGLLH